MVHMRLCISARIYTVYIYISSTLVFISVCICISNQWYTVYHKNIIRLISSEHLVTFYSKLLLMINYKSELLSTRTVYIGIHFLD